MYYTQSNDLSTLYMALYHSEKWRDMFHFIIPGNQVIRLKKVHFIDYKSYFFHTG